MRAFFRRPASQSFFLTGGTALAEFYLHHRYSEDIDLFTLDRNAYGAMITDLSYLSEELNCSLTVGVSAVDFRSIFFERVGESRLKVDLVRDAGPQFDAPQRFNDVIVNSLLDIAVNKVTALFGRAAVRDFVDLYFLLKQGFDLNELMRLAQEKDLGFTEFYFAGALHEIQRARELPRMILPLTLEELRAFFSPLAEQIMLRAKPAE
ncbi:MAG: nucleotidyl transferase AbiEii/AbiGii toxin family protein [Chloroflexi bacterium]|nr:nucleotidyl transferase AbiEii/AbiGii toxin family protein [Chloroflexota bacterium]MBI3740329.1 nucleotidyl transferase AbiEii/AbiGii toxin family protein [Chloroflexota bacterium]